MINQQWPQEPRTTTVERLYGVEVETTVTMVRKTKDAVFNAETISHSKFTSIAVSCKNSFFIA